MSFVIAKKDDLAGEKNRHSAQCRLAALHLLYRAPIIFTSTVNSGNKYVRIYTAMIHNGIIKVYYTKRL